MVSCTTNKWPFCVNVGFACLHQYLVSVQSCQTLYSDKLQTRTTRIYSTVLFMCPLMCYFFGRLVKVTLYGSQIKLYNIETAVPSVLKPDLIDV